MSDDSPTYTFNAVAIVRSVFKEKFAIPRQSGLAPSAQARIELLPPYNHSDFVDGLEHCSHIWLQFVFHEHWQTAARAKVRPPRLGGNQKLGVFATRSPVRPNAIGLSVVALNAIEVSPAGVSLRVSGVDMVDGTPVLDIKPYVPYADGIADAKNDIAPAAPPTLPVIFSSKACDQLKLATGDLAPLLEEILSQDPRPQYQAIDSKRLYGVYIDHYNVTWRYLCDAVDQSVSIEVVDIKQK